VKKKRRKGLAEKVGPCSQKRGLNVWSAGSMRGYFLEGLRFLQQGIISNDRRQCKEEGDIILVAIL
jgi:hypothetical protein